MADQKISELNALTGVNAADDDALAIVDTSATETKKITRAQLFTDTPSIDVSGNITVSGTVDGRDVAADGTKLDGIEASADVTDTTNVTAAGALMDSEVTNLAQVKAFDSSDYATAAQGSTADAALARSGGTMTGAITFAAGQAFSGDGSNLTNVAAASIEVSESADDNVTYNILFSDTDGTGNVQMTPTQDDGGLTYNPALDTLTTYKIQVADSIVHRDDTNTYIDFGSDEIRLVAGGVEFIKLVEGTDDYVRFAKQIYLASGQNINFEGSTADDFETTLYVVDPTADRTITLPDATGTVALDDVATTSAKGLMSSSDKTKLDGIEASADVTDVTNVTAAGALMDSELTDIASVKALNQGVATTNSPTFAALTVDGHTLQDSTDRSGLLSLTTALGTWRGIQIEPTTTSKWSVMGDQDDFGLYDDENNEWIILYNENSTLQLFSNGTNSFTVQTTGATVTGNLSVTGTVDGRDVATDGTKLDGIESGATADQTAAEILTAIKTVDGSGSGLDADTVDGIEASQFLRSDASDTMTGNLTVDNGTSTTLSVKCDDGGNALVRANGDNQGTGALEVGQSNSYGGGISYNGDGSPAWAGGETADNITFYRLENGTRTEVFHYPYNSDTVNFNGSITLGGTVDGRDVATDGTKLDGIEASADVTDTANVTAAGALMDSEVTNLAQVKAFDSSDYATAAQGTTADAALPKAGGTMTAPLEISTSTNEHLILSGATDPYIRFQEGTTDKAMIQWSDSGVLQFRNQENGKYAFWPTVTAAAELVLLRNDTTTTSGEDLGSVNFGHTDGTPDFPTQTVPQLPARILAQATESTGTYDDGARLSFYTKATNANKDTNSIERVRIDQDGTSRFYGDIEINSGGASGSACLQINNSSSGTFNKAIEALNSNLTSGESEQFMMGSALSTKNVADWRFQYSSSGSDSNFMSFGFWGVDDILKITAGKVTTVDGTFNNNSDERLKENIKPIENALSDICQLEGVTFDWKESGTQGQGFIAQQVEPIIPDVVNTDEDTGMKSINYVGLIGHLVEAIKTQQTQIDDLKAGIQSMKS